MEDYRRRYTIGWIAISATDFIAARELLDEDHGPLYVGGNIYHGGKVGKHNVVLAVQPNMQDGTTHALYWQLYSRFWSMELVIVVGIGGGVPRYDVRRGQVQIALGDVVVSYAEGITEGLIEHGFQTCQTNDEFMEEVCKSKGETVGKREDDEEKDNREEKGEERGCTEIVHEIEESEEEDFEKELIEQDHIDGWSKQEQEKWYGRLRRYKVNSIIPTIEALQSRHTRRCSTRIPILLQEIRANTLANERDLFADPGAVQDRLFDDEYAHTSSSLIEECETCEPQQSRARKHRSIHAERIEDSPNIHYGNMISGGKLPNSALERNQYQQKSGAISFLQGGSYSYYNFKREQYLIVCGICNYADSHGNMRWRPYASATAAAFTKELLEILPASAAKPHPDVEVEVIEHLSSYSMTPTFCQYCENLQVSQIREAKPVVFVSLAVIELHYKSGNCPTGGCQVMFKAAMGVFPETAVLSHRVGMNPCRLGNGIAILHLDFDGWQLASHSHEYVELFVTDGLRHPTWTAIIASEAHSNLASEDSLRFAKAVLQDCQQKHKTCTLDPDQKPFMPKRVLDIGNVCDSTTGFGKAISVKLVETSGHILSEPYVALSHRWGPPGRTITTQINTLEQHKLGITFEDLGVIYQDIVHMLRRLGIRYVWIDSLCIIQDSAQDWKEQSRSMADIYSCALYTIARQCDSETLESVRSLKGQCHQLTELPSSISVFARLQIPHIGDEASKNSFPLFSRGWIYQERLLSRRTLHVSNRELSWICREDSACQCRTGKLYAESGDLTEHIYIRWLQECKGSKWKIAESNTVTESWRSMVEHYTKLELTKSSDRLVAIQGCAEQFQRTAGLHYMEGLWRETFVADILWSVSAQSYQGWSWDRPSCMWQSPQRNPGLFSEPTWSWASVCQPVSFQKATKIFAQLVPASYKTYDMSVHSHFVRLQGRMIPARLRLKRGKDEHPRERTPYAGIDESREASGYIDIDEKYKVSVNMGPQDQVISEFEDDFDLRSSEEFETSYDVSLLLLARFHSRDICLVLWDYGKMIPGACERRQTEDGIPIHQRIGLFSQFVRIKHFRKYEDEFREHWEAGTISHIDWTRAERATVAIE